MQSITIGFDKSEQQVESSILQQLRARTRGIQGNVVLMLKIPIELQCDYSSGLLLQIA
jgi:hypothetical protein